MGNSIGRASHCFAGDAGEISRRHNDVALEPLDEGLGHSFCYVRPDPPKFSFSSSYSEEDYSFATTTFRSISGASVSANTSTPVSTSLADLYMYGCSSSVVDRAASFASSTSFASTPLQPVPRCSTCGLVPSSGPMAERGFISGPMERGFLSGPIDRGLYSSPTDNKVDDRRKVEENVSTINNGKVKSKKRSLFDIFKKMKFRKIFRDVALDKDGGVRVKEPNLDKKNGDASGCHHVFLKGVDGDEESEVFMERKNLQWAQGKAGEDRVQVVISEEHGWLFVGIYDGFNGPDAPEFLVSNLYSILHMELKGLLWNDKEDEVLGNGEMGLDLDLDLDLDLESNPKRKQGKCSKSLDFESDGERIELDDKKLKRETGGINHSEVLKALSEALRKTEDAYLEIADKMVSDNPELALMGSCVLVMLMKGEDVYLMNVGDSRAVLAQEAELDVGPRKMHQDLKRINEEILSNRNTFGGVGCGGLINSISLQLTTDHSTHVEEEVQRIRNDHPDDASAIINDRVKGYLKVTRAFGVGFLKQPKWNDALLEIFRINYVGTSSYITCFPSLYHYRLGPRDRFLILSSDGLYQYFTNEEAVSQVESFIASFPEGDPAQHLIEEVLFRAAKKAGLDFHELLDIRQGERRRYHDDVSVIIVSLEGRIWRSSI